MTFYKHFTLKTFVKHIVTNSEHEQQKIYNTIQCEFSSNISPINWKHRTVDSLLFWR